MYLTNFYKKCLLKLKYNAKSVCVFHLFLIDIPSILILSVKNTGWGGGGGGGGVGELLIGQNLLIVRKVICQQSYTQY